MVFFGLNSPQYTGFFYIYHKLIYLFSHTHEICIPAFIMGSVTIIILLITSYLNRKYSRQFPDLLFIIIISIIFTSYYPELYQTGCMGIVGNIPSQFPSFQLPIFQVAYYFPLLRISIILAIITGTMNFTLVKSLNNTFSEEEKISDTQELIAYALTCLIGSLFQCFLPSGSLSRSLVLANIGVRSNLASIFTVPCLLVILKYFISYMATLPKPVLAAAIIVALQNAFKQFGVLPVLYRSNFIGFLEWSITFILVILLDIELGLFMGIAVSVTLKQFY